jgi:hypothetical protein
MSRDNLPGRDWERGELIARESSPSTWFRYQTVWRLVGIGERRRRRRGESAMMVIDTSLVCIQFFFFCPSHDRRYMRQRRHVHMYCECVLELVPVQADWRDLVPEAARVSRHAYSGCRIPYTGRYMIIAENYAFTPHELRQLVVGLRVSVHYSVVYVCAVEGEVVVSFVRSEKSGDGSRLF